MAALRLLAQGHSDSQVLQLLEGITKKDLQALLKYIHSRLPEPKAPYAIDPCLAHLRADLRATKGTPSKCRSTTPAERDRAWRAYVATKPTPQDETFVRSMKLPVGLVGEFRGALSAFARHQINPPPQWKVARALAKDLRALERAKRLQEVRAREQEYKNRRLARTRQ